MEAKINIAEILRNKPSGIKLYSPIFGNCTYCYIHDETSDICIRRPYNEMSYFNFEGLYNTAGECLLFPSKEMRNWSKFAWKKGDVLVSDNGKVEVIFEKFVNDTYQSFIGKHHLDNLEDNLYYQNEGEYLTSIFNTESKNAAQTYVKTLEKKLGGKLNHETLEVEKTQPEFKDGDVLFVKCKGSTFIGIFNYSKNNGNLYYHASLDTTTQDLDISGKYRIGKDEIDEIRLATEEEKKQFFSALANKGKAWGIVKKVVNLKPKFDELKPFDKVVVFNELTKKWEYGIFNYYSKNYEGKEVITCIGGCTYFKVLPFNEETAKLLGTINNVED